MGVVFVYSLWNSYSSTNNCTCKCIHQITNACTYTVDTWLIRVRKSEWLKIKLWENTRQLSLSLSVHTTDWS